MVRPVAVLSCPAAGQAACHPLGHECSLGRRELQLSFVQEPCPHTLFCILFASAEPGLLGVVDKEKEMNNLYFTFSQRLPTGLLSRKNIPGLQSQRESMCQVQPIVPSSHWDITQTDVSGCRLGLLSFYFSPWKREYVNFILKSTRRTYRGRGKLLLTPIGETFKLSIMNFHK